MSDQRNTNYWLFFWPSAVFFLLFGLNVIMNGWPDWNHWLGVLKAHEEATSAIRNIGLIALGFAGIILAIIRTKTASDQRDIANKQARTSIDQVRIAQQGQYADRYAKAASMLSDPSMPVREAGIFALRELAKADFKDHYFPVQNLLCSFMRNRSAKLEDKSESAPSPSDIVEALRVFSDLRDETAIKVEREARWQPDLREIYVALFPGHIRPLNLKDANLTFSNFEHAQLNGAQFQGCKLEDTYFDYAELNEAEFDFAVLKGSRFFYSKLVQARFFYAGASDTDYTQAILTDADFQKADVSFANFSGADLTGVSFTKTNLLGTLMPTPILPKECWPEGKIPSRVDKKDGLEYYVFKAA